MKIYGVAFLMLPILSGCGVIHPGIAGSGISGSEIRQLDAFDEVNLSGFGTVNVVPGPRTDVRVTTDDNLLAHVETEVRDGKLKIHSRQRIRPKTGLRVDVTVPKLTAARISGAGELNVSDMVGDQVDLSISGIGSLKASGYVKNLNASISGAGEADLRELLTENTTVNISGAGDASVYASQSVDANISGVGDVVCYGNPVRVKQKASGAGGLELRTAEAPVEITLSDQMP